MNPTDVAKQFLQFYYPTFGANRAGVFGLYHDSAVLDFEGKKYEGKQSVLNYFQEGMNFKTAKYYISSFTAQNSSNGGMIIFVIGKIVIDNDENPINFNEVFQIFPAGGSFTIVNQMFRFNLG